MRKISRHFGPFAILAATAAGAAAQEPKASPPKPAAVEGVTVTAPSQGLRTTIDRRSYGVVDDLQTQSGSVADALRAVPSVDVDAQGNVSLRGSGNVTIMVDGKPSAMTADALAALPANQVERIEVITNPSAAFNPDGSGGIINLISKKTRGQGGSGQVAATYGDLDRYNLGLTGAYNTGALSLNGNLSARNFVEDWASVNERTTTDAASGLPLIGVVRSTVLGEQNNLSAKVGASFDLDTRRRINLSLGGLRGPYEGVERLRFDATVGGAARTIDRVGDLNIVVRNIESAVGYRQQFAGEGHELTADLRFEAVANVRSRGFTYAVGAPVAGAYEHFLNSAEAQVGEAKIEYKRPLAGDGKLLLGIQHDSSDGETVNDISRGASTATALVDRAFQGRFHYGQTRTSVYGTWQSTFGPFGVLAGVRLENTDIEILERTTGQAGGQAYTELYPSLHATYDLSENSTLKFSYSRRVQRPSGFDLAPVRNVNGLNYSEGNPNLKPVFTDAFEGGYEYRKGQTSYMATAYYRAADNPITSVIVDLGDGRTLSKRQNIGSSRTAGLELVAGGRLSPTLSYRLNANLFQSEIDPGLFGYPVQRTSTAMGRGNLDWQPTPKDFFQINLQAIGKQLIPQGYSLPFHWWNLGYRRTFNDRLSGTITVKDAFKGFVGRQVLESPGFKSRSRTEYFDQFGVYVGLSYALGSGRRQRDADFDFTGAQP